MARLDRNDLVAAADSGCEQALASYGPIAIPKRENLDPEFELRDVFTWIADGPVNRVEELLPRKIASVLAMIS